MDALKLKVLELLKEDARRSAALIATMLDVPEDKIKRVSFSRPRDLVEGIDEDQRRIAE